MEKLTGRPAEKGLMDVTLGGGGCSYQLEVGAGEHHAAEERISLSCVGDDVRLGVREVEETRAWVSRNGRKSAVVERARSVLILFSCAARRMDMFL